MTDAKEPATDFVKVEMTSFDKLKATLNQMEAELPKIAKGNKSACRRNRVRAMGAIKGLRNYRLELLDMYKAKKK